MNLDTLGIRFERLRETVHLGYRQRGLLRQWRSFLVLLRRGQVRNTFSHSSDITGETSAYDAKNALVSHMACYCLPVVMLFTTQPTLRALQRYIGYSYIINKCS
jgi:hypothetical protein